MRIGEVLGVMLFTMSLLVIAVISALPLILAIEGVR